MPKACRTSGGPVATSSTTRSKHAYRLETGHRTSACTSAFVGKILIAFIQLVTISSQQRDVSAFEEAIRTLLEIINRALTNQLRTGTHLVYTMLYKRQLFDQLHEQPLFHDLGWNIAAVLNHFSTRVQTLGNQATPAQVLLRLKVSQKCI